MTGQASSERPAIDVVTVPQAVCRAGVARRDITPPVGIYHRMWGAATHDRATGMHRPLTATALALESQDPQTPGRQVLVALDHCLLWHGEMRTVRSSVCQAIGLAECELQIAFSHTHAAGLMDRSRATLPGGELVGPYLDRMTHEVIEAVREAFDGLAAASVVYGTGQCSLAAHRDYWDPRSGQYVCGFNPAGAADNTLLLARIDAESGGTLAVVVNYACHPTTLAWDNTLISPDYVGALRELVEDATGALCLFLQGASGDLGPGLGFVGDLSVADRHGRQLGYAVLSTLESLPPAGTQLEYAGSVVSGATLGVWKHGPLPADVRPRVARWRSRSWTVELPYRAELPTLEQTRELLDHWQQEEQTAQRAGDADAARDCRAQAERMLRQLTRLSQLPAGESFPLPVTLWQLGDAYWLMLEGEYYQALQLELRRQIAQPLIVATVVNGWRPAYLPTRETYDRDIYQANVAVLAPGCLESLTQAISQQLRSWERAEARAE